MSFKAPHHFAVFGGSFNPLHQGHVSLLRHLSQLEDIRQVLVIPARRSPFKQDAETLPDALRWAMLRRVLPDIPRVSLLDLELLRPPPSYTWDTLSALESRYPRATFSLVMGEDAFAGFSGWSRAAHLLERCALLVTRRIGTQPAGILDASALAAALPPPWPGRVAPRDAETLVTPDGRAILRLFSWNLPNCASSRILAQRDATDVPEAARELLKAHWRLVPPAKESHEPH